MSTKPINSNIRRAGCQAVTASQRPLPLHPWRKLGKAHIGNLTLEQLHSPEECRVHLDSFPRTVVSQGLALTPVASNDGVQDVITAFLRLPEYIMPPAASMKVITHMQREFHIGVMLKEIREIVKKAALEGRDRTVPMYPGEHSGHPGDLPCIDCVDLQSRRNFTADPIWLDKLFAVLRKEGYYVHETKRKRVNSYVATYAFFLTWTEA